jgi:hypothetical protein
MFQFNLTLVPSNSVYSKKKKATLGWSLYLGYGVEAGVLLLVLYVVGQAPEHQHAHQHQGEQQAQV